jgi:hypothetical protein
MRASRNTVLPPDINSDLDWPYSAGSLPMRQRARYLAEKARPTGRNLGPSRRRCFSGPDRTWRTARWVVINVNLAAGAIVGGRRILAPARLVNYPLTPPLHSEGQTKKALRRVQRRYPSARIILMTWDTNATTALSPAAWDVGMAPVFEDEVSETASR